MNLGIFTGNLGRDAELRKTNNGENVSNFPLAVEIGTKAEPNTLWLDCAVFGKRADAINQYLKKGLKVTVQGRIDLRKYQKSDGTFDAAIRLTCNDLDMHGSKPQDGQQSYAPAPAPQKKNEYMDDNIPF